MRPEMFFICALLLFISRVCPAVTLVIAPHPDDGEASCGGLMVNTIAAGEQVVILTMTGGEMGIMGKPPDEARAIRAEEAKNAGVILGADVQFFGATDGGLEVTAENAEKLRGIIAALKADVVLAPWPLDVHPDHQASGLLAWRVFHDKSSAFELYFFETGNLPHTKTFQFVPTHYVDITDAMKQKQKALYDHKSQVPAAWFDQYRDFARFRGYESDTTFAEAYIKARNYSSLDGRPAVAVKTLPGEKKE